MRRGLSLRIKVFFLFFGAALLIVVPALMLIARAVEHGVYTNANSALSDAADKVTGSWEEGGLTLVYAAQFKAASSTVTIPWTEGHTRTLGRALRADLGNEVALAVDTAFRPLVGPVVDRAALERALESGTVVALPPGSPPLRLAASRVRRDTTVGRAALDARRDSSAQVRPDTLLGVVAIGTPLSASALAPPRSRDTRLALLVGDSLVSTTFPDSLVPTVRRWLRPRTGEMPKTWQIGDETFLPATMALPSGGVPVRVVLFRRIGDEPGMVKAVKQSMIGIGVAALVMALVLAALVSRIVARPTQALAEASARLARGDYAAPLPRDAGDEIGQLARAFGEMRAAIAQREQRLRSAQAEMIHREKLAAMGRLVAQLSHEINNPIYNIQNCLEALERRGDPGDPNREFLTLAQEELARMATLTRQLLDQSRPLSDAAQPVSLNAVVQRVLTLAGPELAAHGIRVRQELGAGLPEVVAHPEGIQQVLANLVNNACDAMPAGGTLRVASRADDEAVEVVVEDTGNGIADADLPHIFEAFYTTKPGVAGLGLGLFVSEGIIRGHRGRLSVESQVGEGSRFVVRLPRETLDEAMRDGGDELDGGEPASERDRRAAVAVG
ncbi:MAG TPA: HAMP domain-containing sensor histidine kinase [Longimicrobium sp.]|nr:HAMP domain-containing sensor histidine kinase [Longimicrobium sp.]